MTLHDQIEEIVRDWDNLEIKEWKKKYGPVLPTELIMQAVRKHYKTLLQQERERVIEAIDAKSFFSITGYKERDAERIVRMSDVLDILRKLTPSREEAE